MNNSLKNPQFPPPTLTLSHPPPQVKEQFEAEREGWRAAALERLQKALAEREREMRRQLEAERDQELEAVLNRLEAETAQVGDGELRCVGKGGTVFCTVDEVVFSAILGWGCTVYIYVRP